MLAENAIQLVHTTNTTASTTWTAYSLEAPVGVESAVVLSASSTGGDGTTKISIAIETSVDGTNWFAAMAASVSSAAGVNANQIAHLCRYVRAKVVISGTAPSALVWDAAVLIGGPLTATAVA